jgi:hypothetical protein
MQASAAALGFEVRQFLRGNIAKMVGLPQRLVTLERISSSSGGCSSTVPAGEVTSDNTKVQTGLEVELHVRLGPNKAAGELLMRKPQVIRCWTIDNCVRGAIAPACSCSKVKGAA